MPLNLRPPGLEKPAPPPPPPLAERGHPILKKVHPAWLTWRKGLEGSVPSPEYEALIIADTKHALDLPADWGQA